MSRALKTIAVLLLSPVVLLVLLGLTGKFWQRGWAPPDNGISLQPKRPVLKADAVALGSTFDLLRRACEMEERMPCPDEGKDERKRLRSEPWSEASFPVLTMMLREREPALALAREAAKQLGGRMPTTLSLTDETFPVLRPTIRLVQTFSASARRMAAKGDLAGAFVELETAMDVARIPSRGGNIVHLMVSMTTERAVDETMRSIALQYDVPPEAARRATKYLLRAAQTEEPLPEVFREEFRTVPARVAMCFRKEGASFFELSKINSADAGPAWLPIGRYAGWMFGSTPSVTTENLSRAYKCAIEIASQPYSVASGRALERLPAADPRGWEWLGIRDPFGLLLAKISLPTFGDILVQHHARLFDLRATAVIIALRQYERDRGVQAESLSDLVGTYWSDVPLDPFDGKPMRYRKGGPGQAIVYSVGADQIDDNGLATKRGEWNHRTRGDIVVCECEFNTVETAAPRSE